MAAPAPVRGNKASMLRAGKKGPAASNSHWAPASTRCETFAPPPIVNPGSSLNSRSRDKIAGSRIPISRLSMRPPSAAQTRNTSPVRGSPLKGTSTVSSCSLPEKKTGAPDRKPDEEKAPAKRPVSPQRMNVLAKQIFSKSRKAGAKGDKHRRVIELNKLRAFESQKKKLEYMQSDFMHKLRTLGPQFPGNTAYKFVAVVVNDECKVVVHDDDLLRLPKNLPTASINDLKHRCRGIVDLGFMLFYDYLPFIQRSRNEFEARDKREEIRNKLGSLVNRKMASVVEEIDHLCGPGSSRPDLCNIQLYREMADLRLQKQHMEGRYFDVKKEHLDEMNKLRSEYEVKMAAQLANRDQTISDLRKNLRRSEELVNEQTIRLAEKTKTLVTEDGTLEELRAEMAKVKLANQRMLQRLEEADVGLERARSSVDKHIAQITYLEGELKEARELIVNLQKRPDCMDKGIVEKDLIIADLKLQLQNLEQHKNVLNKQVVNALKHHTDFEELNGKYKDAVVQISDLKESLKITTTKSEFHSKAEEQLRKEIAKMREQMALDQQMLTARSELINNLQKTEQENRTKLDQMYYQVSEKDTLITQVNNELASKEEEFRNLFGTLTSKQAEVRRQDHVIQLLKEQHSRVSFVRAGQDERNAALDKEIKDLKNTLYSLTLGNFSIEEGSNEVLNLN
ncbi:myosin-14 isoform X3 [Drosophila subpulchrella]|uniref:myosin-14 isoform X3 n=1 Tax=Drosophila subpulchrella TaxID=1486046 RepID=UPI0018A13AAD|nr:myosin-14 isoform X3 [Drosophila subpulchrella]